MQYSPHRYPNFRIGEYFDIKVPGWYTAKVWPKVYWRPSTNDDICTRVDLPPVTAIFKWDGDSSNGTSSVQRGGFH